MRIGAIFPQTEIGSDPGGVKDYAQAVEAMGFAHILAFDHVVGADLTNRPDWKGPYSMDSSFHEPFVLFGYLAGVTQTVELTTGIIILPQRQAVLAAKQAAAIDVLSGGRLRLGIGLGWNEVEFEALNEEFGNRGSRAEEQIELMRALWTERSVDFKGKWHTVSKAGLNPMPVQQPIPVWMGGGASEFVQRRIARVADGWMPLMTPDDKGREAMETFRGYLREYGRDVDRFGIEGWVKAISGDGRWRCRTGRGVARVGGDSHQREHYGPGAERRCSTHPASGRVPCHGSGLRLSTASPDADDLLSCEDRADIQAE